MTITRAKWGDQMRGGTVLALLLSIGGLASPADAGSPAEKGAAAREQLAGEIGQVTIHPDWAEVLRTVTIHFDEHRTMGNWSPRPGQPWVGIFYLSSLPPDVDQHSLRVSTPTPGASVISWMATAPTGTSVSGPPGFPRPSLPLPGLSAHVRIADQAKVFDIAFEITYVTRAASWQAAYRVDWSESESELELLTEAVVVQHTGEIWDAPVLLSDGPSAVLAGPGVQDVELGRVSVSGNGVEARIALPLERLSVRRGYRVQPSFSSTAQAFLVVRAPQQRALRSGPLTVLVNGSYAGHASLSDTAAGAEARIPFGVADEITCTRVASTAERDDGPTRVRLTLDSRLATPAEVEVVEPLRAGHRIVSKSRGGTLSDGLVTWRLRLGPRETRTLVLRQAPRRD